MATSTDRPDLDKLWAELEEINREVDAEAKWVTPTYLIAGASPFIMWLMWMWPR